MADFIIILNQSHDCCVMGLPWQILPHMCVADGCASVCGRIKTIWGSFVATFMPLLKITENRSCVFTGSYLWNFTSKSITQKKNNNNEARLHSPHGLRQEQPPTLKPTQAHNSAHWPNQLLLTGIFFTILQQSHEEETPPAHCLFTAGLRVVCRRRRTVALVPEQPDKLVRGRCHSSRQKGLSQSDVFSLVCLITLLKY